MPNIVEPSEPQAVEISGSYSSRLDQARWRRDHGEWDEAAEIYERLVWRLSRLPERRRLPGSELHGYLVAAASELARVRASQDDFAAVRQLCQQLLEWDPPHAADWRQYEFYLRIESGQVELGLAGLRQLAEDEPDNLDLWLDLGSAAVDAKEVELTEMSLQRAAALAQASVDARSNVRVHLLHFQLYRLQRRWQEAGREWNLAVELDPDVERTRLDVLCMFLEAELWDDAQRYLGGGLVGPIADFYEGYLAYRRGDRMRARALWRKMVQAAPDEDQTALSAQALAWCYLGEPVQALRLLLDKVSSSRIVQGRPALTLALAWAMEGDLDAARVDLGIAGEILLDSPDDKLSRLDWYDFDQLVQDEAIKATLRPYFETE